MFKIKEKYLTLIFIMSAGLMSVISEYSYSGIESVSPDYVYGKVVYSDNNSPVNHGYVKFYISDESGNELKILEISEIDTDGTFRVSREVVTSDYNPKIMAYRNDYDNTGEGFKTEITNLKSVIEKSGNEIKLIIHVNRVHKGSTNEQ